MSVYIFDLDGVVYRGHDPVPGAAEAIAALRARSHTVTFATNNSTRTRAEFAAKLSGMGVPAMPTEVMTSSYATAHYLLHAARPAGNLLVLGESGLHQELAETGLSPVHDPDRETDYVVVGLDRQFSYARLALAQTAVLAGATLIATNRDPQFPSEGGRLTPGAGSIVAAVETACRQPALSIGKPEPHLFTALLDRLGTPLAEVIVVGDNLLTDIGAAARLGCYSVLVLTGVSTRADIATSAAKPDLVIETLEGLLADG